MGERVVYGLHAVQALLKSHASQIRQVWLLEGRRDARLQALEAQALAAGLTPVRVPRRELDKVCGGNHQGAIAFAAALEAANEAALDQLLDELEQRGQPPLLLVLDGITDPHNLGACLRSADAAGAHAVIAPKDNSASLTDSARKVASGAAEVVPFVQVTNLARCLDRLKARGVWLVGAAGEAPAPIFDTPLTGPLALVLGAEGMGLRRLTREACDYLAAIPMQGSVSSLNVSVAAGVFLFEALRQRRLAPAGGRTAGRSL